MPTYDYKCNACSHTFELFQSMTAKHEKKCPSCGKLKLERLIGTGAALIFKGGGFYQTDYRTESYKQGESAAKDATKPAEASTSSDSKSAAATQAKSDSKPETKAEAKSQSKSETKSPAKSAKSESTKASKPAAKK